MRYVEFGNTGEMVSQMCLGTMMFGQRCDEAESDRILGAAIDGGVTFVDTAAMYAEGVTEEILGRVLKGRRDGLFIATKVHKGVDAGSILESIDESLARLQLDYVDLYLIHWPKVGMRPREIMEALHEVVAQEKARYVGCCNYSAWLYAHSNAIAARNGWTPLVCNQIPYNLIERGVEVEILPQAVAEGVAITTYRPLVRGILAAKYPVGGPVPADSRGQTDARIPAWVEKYGQAIRRFEQFAAGRGLHPAQLAIAWVCHSPAITAPIVGASSAAQLEATIPAFDVGLSDEEYAEVTGMFDTAVKEEAGGRFPELRRTLDLVG
jgi:aryl-alcohol dehydrogenase-like predicted oxidoreductase